MLKTTNIVNSRKNQTYIVFTGNVSANFTADTSLPSTMKSSDYVKECWRRYQLYAGALPPNNSLNGKMFETIIATELYRQKLTPFYQQAEITFVPNVNYDIVLYDTQKKHPISLSIKTSTRERYKQADLEAVALKYVHRKAENYLIMLDATEASSLKAKVTSGDLLGIDAIIQADTVDFDNLIARLKAYSIGTPVAVDIIKGTII